MLKRSHSMILAPTSVKMELFIEESTWKHECLDVWQIVWSLS